MTYMQAGPPLPVYIANRTPQIAGPPQPVVLVDTSGNPLLAVNVSAYAQTLLGAADASAARATLGASAAVPRGRPSVSGLSGLSLPGCAITSVNTAALSNGSIRYAPILVETAITIDQLVIEVTTNVGGTHARVGIYAADLNWQPGALVVDGGSLDTGAAAAVVAATVNVTLPPGRYLTAINSDGAPTLRRIIGGSNLWGMLPTLGASPLINAISVASAFGAFQDPGVQWASGGVSGSASPPNHFVFLHVATP